MSTNVADFNRSGLLSSNTVARSILGEERSRRGEPEDWRTRRFGYNPGFIMTQDPVLSGLQTTLIEPGVLILFETSPVFRPNWSVDPEDNSEPHREVDLLAGEGLYAVHSLYQAMGWRELRSLRGLPDDKAVDLFYSVHAPLHEYVNHGIIPECPYNLTVCVTCRQKALETIKAPPLSATQLLAELKESVTTGRGYMEIEWNKYVGEYAKRLMSPGNDQVGITELREGHLFFMRQLHQRTPNDQELAKISLQADRQAIIMKEAMNEMAEKFAALVQRQPQQPDPAVTAQMQAMQEQMNALRLQIAELSGAVGDEPVANPSTAPETKDESTTE